MCGVCSLFILDRNYLLKYTNPRNDCGGFLFYVKNGREMKSLKRLIALLFEFVGAVKENTSAVCNPYEEFLGPESYKQVY